MRFPYCPSGTNCLAQRRVPQQVPMAWCVQVEAAWRKASWRPVAVARGRTSYPDFGQVPHARMVCRALIAAQQSPRTEVAPPASALISAYICASQAKVGIARQCRLFSKQSYSANPTIHSSSQTPVGQPSRLDIPGELVMEIDETGQNDPRHLDRRVGRADALRPSLVARYDAHRAWQVRAERCQ